VLKKGSNIHAYENGHEASKPDSGYRKLKKRLVGVGVSRLREIDARQTLITNFS